MNWESRIIGDTELRPYRCYPAATNLASTVQSLISHQAAHWPLLTQGMEALAHVSTKRISLGDFDVVAQFNPRRIASTAAAVDKSSIQNRPCFLCGKNLPPEEKGIAYGEEFMILCNPFPILNQHLTIVHRRHIEQAIAGRFETMLDVAKDLSPDFFVLYNGPQCGASAPDHFHLQAALRKGLPLETHLALIGNRSDLDICQQEILKTDDAQLFWLEKYHLNALIYRGSRREALIKCFYRAVDILTEATGTHPEPLVNVIATFDDPAWTVVLFPRAKHRPACYYAEDENQLLVSPGAVDLAGWLVVPLEAHFQKIDSASVKQIFAEVTLEPRVFSDLLQTLSQEDFPVTAAPAEIETL